MNKEITIDALRHSREQRIGAARQDYARLLRSAAVKPEMSANDAAAMENALNVLCITLDELDADLKAVRDVTAKESQRPTDEDLAALAQERDEFQAQADKFTSALKDAEAELQRAMLAVQRARSRHTDALNKIRIASEEIIRIQNSRPRAFGNWNTGQEVATKMKLAS